MSLASYADLLTAVQNYEDDATTVVSGVVADMVTLAEQRIYNGFAVPGAPLYTAPLRVRALERQVVLPIGPGLAGGTSAGSANAQTVTLASVPTLARGLTIKFTAGYSNTGAFTLNPNSLGAVDVKKGKSFDALEDGDILQGGVYTVYHDGTRFVLLPSDGCCPLPSRFLGAKSAYLQDRGKILTQMPETGMNLWMDGQTVSEPDYYTIVGDVLRFSPLPNDTYYLNLNYYARPAALSTALNDVFRDAPAIYLYGTLLELGMYLPNEAMVEKMMANFTGACNAYMAADRASSVGYGPMRLTLPLAP